MKKYMESSSVVPRNITQYLFIESKALAVCVKFCRRHFISWWMEFAQEVRGIPDTTVGGAGDFKVKFANVNSNIIHFLIIQPPLSTISRLLGWVVFLLLAHQRISLLIYFSFCGKFVPSCSSAFVQSCVSKKNNGCVCMCRRRSTGLVSAPHLTPNFDVTPNVWCPESAPDWLQCIWNGMKGTWTKNHVMHLCLLTFYAVWFLCKYAFMKKLLYVAGKLSACAEVQQYEYFARTHESTKFCNATCGEHKYFHAMMYEIIDVWTGCKKAFDSGPLLAWSIICWYLFAQIQFPARISIQVWWIELGCSDKYLLPHSPLWNQSHSNDLSRAQMFRWLGYHWATPN